MTQKKQTIMHANTIAMEGTKGVLIRGASGSGKSDLTLRMMAGVQGTKLVSDDQTDLQVAGDVLLASAPETIKGKIEVRGIGIVDFEAGDICNHVPIRLIVDLIEDQSLIERLPADMNEDIMGVIVPVIKLYPFEASAGIKLCLALKKYT